MSSNLTENQIHILKILSKGNDYIFNTFLERSSKDIDRLINLYLLRKPLLDDLNNHGIHISDIDDLSNPKMDAKTFADALPILVSWLNKPHVSYHVREVIVNTLIAKPISKQYIFDKILEEFKTQDRNYKDDLNSGSTYFMILGNALMRWVDDSHADVIFKLLEDKKYSDDNFLLFSTVNFKEPKNRDRAKDMLISELEQNGIDDDRILTIITAMRKLNAVEEKDLIHFYIASKNTDIRNEAKKTIAKFDKIEKTGKSS